MLRHRHAALRGAQLASRSAFGSFRSAPLPPPPPPSLAVLRVHSYPQQLSPPLSAPVRGLAYNGTSRNWAMLPSGTRWCELTAGGNDSDATPVQESQVVRVHYVCRLDDGSSLVDSTASWRLGTRSSAVCAALDEVVPGMRLGDTRRCRAPPQSARGRALAGAPQNEILEYDVTLTGYVSQMKIHTLEERGPHDDDPLMALVEFGKRQTASLAKTLTALTRSSK